MGRLRRRFLVDPVKLYSILVTNAGRPLIGSRHVIRYAERFRIARVALATQGPPSMMPTWAVTWGVDDNALAICGEDFLPISLPICTITRKLIVLSFPRCAFFLSLSPRSKIPDR
jgi:hypothetical protein